MIAYEGNNSFCYATDVFTDAANAFNVAADSLIEIKDKLYTRVDELSKKGWQSDAGRTFLEKIDQDWCNDIQRYADLSYTLATMIEYGATEFDLVTDQAQLIRYEEELTKFSSFK